jgi:uncharacterized protein (TIGR02186 family)
MAPTLVRRALKLCRTLAGALLFAAGIVMAATAPVVAQAASDTAASGNQAEGVTRDAASQPAAVRPPRELPSERVHADISTRSVRVTSSFTGTEIIIFGAIQYGRPEYAATDDIYDIVVLVEGTAQPLVARRKSRVGGIWINTNSLTFESVPSYYAISSTRPLEEIADPIVLRNNDIGFEQVRMQPVSGWETGMTTADLRAFREAVIRLKIRDGLYKQDDYSVAFVGGASLFRTTIDLPANIPVGTLTARVFLFRSGQVLDKFETQVRMQREGIERFLFDFAFGYPLIYGIVAVLVAAGAGLAASSYFGRRRG